MKDKPDTEDGVKIITPEGVEVTFAPIPPVLSALSLDESEYSSFGEEPKYESYGVFIINFNDDEE